MLPESLYRLANADVETQWLNSQLRRVTDVGLHANPYLADLVIPNDQVWLIDRIHLTGDAGAAQTSQNLLIQIVFPDANGSLIEVARSTLLVVSQTELAFSVSAMVVKGPAVIRGRGDFSGFVASNTLALNVAAMSLPRGNVNQR